MASSQLKLILNWYELEGKNLIGEEELRDFTVDDLLRLFNEPFWNGLYQCWAITAEHITTLHAHTNHRLQLDRYAYFVEAINLND